MLTERKKKAYREYLKDFNMSAAMQRAGFAKATGDKNGWRMFNDPEGALYLKGLMDKANAKTEITAERVIEELRRLALSDIVGYYKKCMKKKKYILKDLDELTPEQSAAISKFEPDKGYTLYNKDGALDKLAKYFKLYSEIDQTVTNFLLMPELKLNGKKVIFDVGRPSAKRAKLAKKD